MSVKAKTKKALQKRFKITGTGKLLRSKQGRKHILTKKSSARKRDLERYALVPKAFAKKFTKLINGL